LDSPDFRVQVLRKPCIHAVRRPRYSQNCNADLGNPGLNLRIGINCGNFSDGLCPVQEAKSRYIDHAGKTVFAADGYGEEFHEGLT
jgi:hypothetical protein